MAKLLGVSTKTIMREMPEVEQQFTGFKVCLQKKTGAGIRAEGSKAVKASIIEALEAVASEQIYTPQERLTIIIGKLLQNQEPVKLYEFTSILKVTEGTISNDLDKLENWFRGHELDLIRKPGLGVYIKGSEKHIRKAILHYIYENINEEQIVGILHDTLVTQPEDDKAIAIKSSRRLLNLVNTEIIHHLEKAIRQAENAMNYKLSDNAYVALIVHLALAVQRMKKGDEIDFDAEFLADLASKYEFAVSTKIAESIAEIFSIVVPKAEIGYITMHLLGARNQYKNRDSSKKIMDNYRLVKLAKKIIKIAQQETGRNLEKNEKLMVGLVNHLGPSISRLNMHLEIRNPLLSDMKAHYPELLALSAKCVVPLEEELKTSLPEAEIAFIAMHLGAAIEDEESLIKTQYRVAIACPTGLGSSRLLATRIKKEYENIKVIDTISAIHVDVAQLKAMQIDFIISTVSIPKIEFPVLVVNSLLLESDKIAIEQMIKTLQGKVIISVENENQTIDFQEKVESVSRYSKAVLDILHHFFMLEMKDKQSKHAVIERIGQTIHQDEQVQRNIVEALKTRESFGSTIIAEHQMILLHSKVEMLQDYYFGIVKISCGMRDINLGNSSDEIKTAVVMLVPAAATKEGLEIMGHISDFLAESWTFTQVLHNGDKYTVRQELNRLLEAFYKEKNKMLLEG